jgi:hypothetical protein
MAEALIANISNPMGTRKRATGLFVGSKYIK